MTRTGERGPEAMKVLVSGIADLPDGTKIRPIKKSCPVCAVPFMGGARDKFCGDSCRSKNHRERKANQP